ncbi:MAG TPA: cytochrome-c peroxidase [Chitinophagaceae bacterium]|nr:cytochrome-c peroxidase [Chitinophagaceae bacterium]
MRKLIVLCIVSASIILACNSGANKETKEDSAKMDELHNRASNLFQSIASLELEEPDPNKVELGKYLYFDTGLSLNRNISCNSCHGLDNYGVDNLPVSPGDDGSLGNRNSPTTFHAAIHKMQFWDGRAVDVEEQARGPILNPVEHNIKDEKQLIQRIKEEGFYDELFAKAFGGDDPITFENLTSAIGAFERTLIPESRFDHYLDGDLTALNEQEKKGLSIFIDAGCITCHSGAALGGQMLQKFGLFSDYWKETNSKTIDLGLYEISGDEDQKHFFKVPGLRNILHTAPYFHDGSVEDIRDAIKIMARLQRDLELSDEEVDNMVAFFESLSADITDEQKANPFDAL